MAREIKVTFKKMERVGFNQKKFDKDVNKYTKELIKKGYSEGEARNIAIRYHNIYKDQYIIWG